MTIPQKKSKLVLISAALLLTSCYIDDPGPIQYTEKQFPIVDFNRLQVGDEFRVRVSQGDFFQIMASGDRRNIEDLTLEKKGNTLAIRYCTFRERRHETEITITMPELFGVNFSGASESRVYGFSGMDRFDVYLSGASVCQVDVGSTHVRAALSGASYLNLHGAGEELEADISGSSAFKAFGFPVLRAKLVLSGASDGNVTASDHLDVVATGASHLSYRGEPTVVSEVSDSSSIHHD